MGGLLVLMVSVGADRLADGDQAIRKIGADVIGRDVLSEVFNRSAQ
ncbi:hypothetical protein H6G65_15480 [Microcystis elabens FACHB-917]|nr:hypothetical protein [Microcystis elabens FACHB-917]